LRGGEATSSSFKDGSAVGVKNEDFGEKGQGVGGGDEREIANIERVA